MSKSVSSKKKTKVKSKLRLIPVGLKTKNRNGEIGTAQKYDYKKWGDLVFEETGERPKAMLNYLVLSAGNAKVNNKGFINAINCRNVFADSPNIDFLPQDNSFGGKIEVWLQNINEGDSFTVQFRVFCSYAGTWNISCSDAMPIQTPIVGLYQSIDFYIPPVDNNYGLILIALEPVFNNGGTWGFQDVIINKVTV